MNEKPTTAQQALAIIVKLTEQFSLDTIDILDAIEKQKSKHLPSMDTSQQPISLMSNLFAYLGGAFILGGLGAFLSLYWDQFSSPMRVGVLLIPGFSLHLVAMLYAASPTLQRALKPIYIVSFLLEISALYVFLYEYFEHTRNWAPPTLFVFGILFIQQAFSFLARKQSVMLFCTITSALGAAIALFDILTLSESYNAALVGMALLVTSYFVGKSIYKIQAGFWYFFAGWFTLGGLFTVLDKWHLDFMVLLPTCFLVFLSTWVKSRTLLFVSIFGLFAFLAYFTAEYFADSLSWPLMLILLGLLFFVLSYVGLRLGRRFHATGS